METNNMYCKSILFWDESYFTGGEVLSVLLDKQVYVQIEI